MHKNTVLLVIIAALAGFAGGFFLANALNRSEMSAARSQTEKTGGTNSTSLPAKDDTELTGNEIRSKIAEADKNPDNFEYQKSLGAALYRYAAMKQDASLLAEAARILDRANGLKGGDFDVLVALGNARFDIGFAKKDTASLQAARDIYSRALDVKPGDSDVMTDLGLTYFIQEPPAYDKAAAELQKVSDSNPKHERSLQFLVQIFVKQNKLNEADKALTKLKAINAGNSSITDLESQISSARGGTSK